MIRILAYTAIVLFINLLAFGLDEEYNPEHEQWTLSFLEKELRYNLYSVTGEEDSLMANYIKYNYPNVDPSGEYIVFTFYPGVAYRPGAKLFSVITCEKAKNYTVEFPNQRKKKVKDKTGLFKWAFEEMPYQVDSLKLEMDYQNHFLHGDIVGDIQIRVYKDKKCIFSGMILGKYKGNGGRLFTRRFMTLWRYMFKIISLDEIEEDLHKELR